MEGYWEKKEIKAKRENQLSLFATYFGLQKLDKKRHKLNKVSLTSSNEERHINQINGT